MMNITCGYYTVIVDFLMDIFYVRLTGREAEEKTSFKTEYYWAYVHTHCKKMGKTDINKIKICGNISGIFLGI